MGKKEYSTEELKQIALSTHHVPTLEFREEEKDDEGE